MRVGIAITAGMGTLRTASLAMTIGGCKRAVLQATARAPIQGRREDCVLTEWIGDARMSETRPFYSVSCHAGGFTAEIVTALVGDDDSELPAATRADLAVPTTRN